MKQLLSLFLVLSLTACAAGPHASTKQTVLAAEESYTAPAQKAEHDPDARPPLEPTLPSPKPASPEASPPDASSPEPPTLAETEEALPSQRVVDPTQGRKTKAVLIMEPGYVVLSALQPDTIARRFSLNGLAEPENKSEGEQ